MFLSHLCVCKAVFLKTLVLLIAIKFTTRKIILKFIKVLDTFSNRKQRLYVMHEVTQLQKVYLSFSYIIQSELSERLVYSSL